MVNFLSDRFREDINKVKATLCVNKYIGVRSYMFLFIKIYNSHTIYQSNQFNINFSTDTLFYLNNSIIRNKV